VPPVARGDEYRVDVIPGEQLPHIPVGGAAVGSVVPVDARFDGLPPVRPHVAGGHELHIGLIQEGAQDVGAARA